MHPLSDGVVAVVLAAGLSRRMAPHNKLLLKGPTGQAMITRVVDALLASKVASVWVVVGHQAAQVSLALETRPVRLVYSPDYESGLAASLVSGIAALPAEVAGAIVCLGDMPGVGTDVINCMLHAYAPRSGRLIILPTHRGQRGNPVLWDRRFFPDILALEGDCGARILCQRYGDDVFEVEVPSPSVLIDFDTPDTLPGLP